MAHLAAINKNTSLAASPILLSTALGREVHKRLAARLVEERSVWLVATLQEHMNGPQVATLVDLFPSQTKQALSQCSKILLGLFK
jgi:hypothetical protein